MPYKAVADRQVIIEKGKIYSKLPTPKNVIIDYERPNVNVQRIVQNEGIIQAEPSTYNITTRPNGEIKVVEKIYDLPPQSTSLHLEQAASTPAKRLNSSYTPIVRTKSAAVLRGTYNYNDPWRSTYRSSYTGRGFGI